MSIQDAEKTSVCIYREDGVSLAICTYNGISRLKETIQSILKQETEGKVNWELLIIDNASTDNTAAFVTQIWPTDRLQQLRIIREEKLGAIHARQRAIREARYSYLSYVDDDNWISDNWITEIHRIFGTYPTVGIISCPSTAHLSEVPPDYFDSFKGWLAIGTRCPEEGIIKQRPLSFWTAGLSLRLEAFDALSDTDYKICLTGRTGNQTYGGEDHELCLTLTLMGWEIYYTHQTSFTHDIPPTRLTVPYMERLIHNGGKSRAILDIYRNEYYQRPFYHPYLSLLDYLLHLCQCALKYGLKRLFGFAKAPLNPNRIGYLHALGRVQSYFIHFSRISQAQRNIQILRSLNASLDKSPTPTQQP